MSDEVLLAIIAIVSGIMTSVGLYSINKQRNNQINRQDEFSSLSEKYDIMFAESAADKQDIKTKLATVEERYDKLLSKYDTLDEKYDNLDKKYNTLLSEHKRVIADNKRKQNQITILQGKVKQLEEESGSELIKKHHETTIKKTESQTIENTITP